MTIDLRMAHIVLVAGSDDLDLARCRNADSPMSEELPDYAGESDLDAARTTDCPTPESSVNGEAGDGSLSGEGRTSTLM